MTTASLTIDSRAKLHERFDDEADRLEAPGADVVPFHDAGNEPAPLEAFVDVVLERGVEFEDPLTLVRYAKTAAFATFLLRLRYSCSSKVSSSSQVPAQHSISSNTGSRDSPFSVRL